MFFFLLLSPYLAHDVTTHSVGRQEQLKWRENIQVGS